MSSAVERRLANLERQVRQTQGIGAHPRMREAVDFGGRKQRHISRPNSDRDGVPLDYITDNQAPSNASYVVIGAHNNLSQERVLTAGSNITLNDTGANGSIEIVSTGGVSATVVYGEVPGGTKNGANLTFTLATTPTTADDVALYLMGVRLERVASSPTNFQFTLSGATITMALAPGAGDAFFADYLKAASSTTVIGEVPSGTKDGVNKTFTLAAAPLTDNEVGVYLTGTRLAKVAATPTAVEFTISGTTITTGLAPASGDSLFADYLK